MVTVKKLQSIVAEIREFCETHADPKQVQKYARFFTEGYDAYGVSKEVFIEQTAFLNRKYQDVLTLDDYIHLGDLLIRSGKYEEASFAIRLLDPFHEQFESSHFQQFGNWLENGICNWGHTDVLSGEILSKFLDDHIVESNELSSWRNSSSKWKRRAVPVTLINQAKTTSNIESLFDFIEPMMHDPDRFVHQGLGWFLREAWKKHPRPAETFLLKWKDTAPRKIYQYATEKMAKEEKERFRAAKKKK